MMGTRKYSRKIKKNTRHGGSRKTIKSTRCINKFCNIIPEKSQNNLLDVFERNYKTCKEYMENYCDTKIELYCDTKIEIEKYYNFILGKFSDTFILHGKYHNHHDTTIINDYNTYYLTPAKKNLQEFNQPVKKMIEVKKNKNIQEIDENSMHGLTDNLLENIRLHYILIKDHPLPHLTQKNRKTVRKSPTKIIISKENSTKKSKSPEPPKSKIEKLKSQEQEQKSKSPYYTPDWHTPYVTPTTP
jgi:hypothetical protein